MSSPHAQIIEWSESQANWRRDALRRLLTGAFGPEDENEVLSLLKAETGLATTSVIAKPLRSEHLSASGEDATEISLLALSDVKNTNRLAPGQKLSFGSKGLTLIYGDNGSGKSGYARIFKRACRARSVEAIQGDIFDSNATKAPATALFEIAMGPDGNRHTAIWEDGKPGPAELARVAVFDSKCASVYVDGDNQVQFIPYNLDCFERLAQLCNRLRDRLNYEATDLRGQTAAPVLTLPEGTPSYTFLSMACCRFRRHRVRCFDGTGGGSWRGGSLRESSSSRRSS